MTKTITTMFGIAVFAAVLFGAAIIAPQAFAGVDPDPNEAGKVTICHNGDDGPETITVSGNSVQKHMDKHGDTIGECEQEPTNCQECFDAMISAGCTLIPVDGCLPIVQEFAECTLTCEGSLDGIDDECVNQASPPLIECVDNAVTTEDVELCLNLWIGNILECSDVPV